LLAVLDQPKARVRTLACERVDDGQAEDRAEYALRVPRDLFALRGHFRAFPIVPGVVELDLAREQSRARWPELGALRRVRRLKFLRPLRAGERLHMSLVRGAGAKVEFCLRTRADGGEKIAVGQLEFEAPRA
jgi:3-hydroxymyristoyl/3-hydroxydecanoyl-(acyl carrier protein) dehydratase